MTATTTAAPAEASSLTDPGLFAQHREAFSGLPTWYTERKATAWEDFLARPMPTRKEERWRFANLARVTLDGFQPVPPTEAAPTEHEHTYNLRGEVPIETAGALHFQDDNLIAHAPLREEFRAQGVHFGSLTDELRANPELVREHLWEYLPGLGSEKFEALHIALCRAGTFLFVPTGVKVALPFLTLHESLADGSALFPHTLVVAGEGAEVTLLEVGRAANPDTRHFVAAAADVFAGPKAKVRYKLVQNWNLQTTAFHLNSVTAAEEANLTAIAINTGSQHARNEQHGRVVGENAHVAMHSLGVVKGHQELDQRTLQTHHAGGSTSDLLYKNALLDEARTIFSGLIRVDVDAQKTDAYQTNRNLLLSGEAEANSLPGLEIEANDVKCSHGATTGQIDESELFYFLARGIPRRKAQELLVFGFFEEIIGKFENPQLAEYVRDLVQHKFVD